MVDITFSGELWATVAHSALCHAVLQNNRGDSSSKYPEDLQSSSQQQPAGRADGGNSIAVFHLSVMGQWNKYTPPRVFPCVHSVRTGCSWYVFTAAVVQ